MQLMRISCAAVMSTVLFAQAASAATYVATLNASGFSNERVTDFLAGDNLYVRDELSTGVSNVPGIAGNVLSGESFTFNLSMPAGYALQVPAGQTYSFGVIFSDGIEVGLGNSINTNAGSLQATGTNVRIGTSPTRMEAYFQDSSTFRYLEFSTQQVQSGPDSTSPTLLTGVSITGAAPTFTGGTLDKTNFRFYVSTWTSAPTASVPTMPPQISVVAVPEPTSVGLLGSAIGALMLARRHRH